MTSAFLVFIGVGLLILAWRGHRDGAIRAGVKGLRPYTPTREESPLAFHFFVMLYLLGGFACLVWGILALAGIAEPLPLR
ncbi:MAG: hypothetical protein DIU62_000510 [Pseudomonadota bacterium]|nr:MAG: hypothetical protein DIU62_11830 [Pseudomonadota bacterium]